MSDLPNEPTVPSKTELELLKARAKVLGLQFHPATGLDKMRVLVNNALAPKQEEITNKKLLVKGAIPYETKTQMQARKRKAAGELIRVIVTNMNQLTKDLPGQIFTAGNSFCTFKKYVPFNAENGFHIPYIIYKMLEEKKCQIFTTVFDKKGRETRKGKLVKEFNITILPPLTHDEIASLAKIQAMKENA